MVRVDHLGIELEIRAKYADDRSESQTDGWNLGENGRHRRRGVEILKCLHTDMGDKTVEYLCVPSCSRCASSERGDSSWIPRRRHRHSVQLRLFLRWLPSLPLHRRRAPEFHH